MDYLTIKKSTKPPPYVEDLVSLYLKDKWEWGPLFGFTPEESPGTYIILSPIKNIPEKGLELLADIILHNSGINFVWADYETSYNIPPIPHVLIGDFHIENERSWLLKSMPNSYEIHPIKSYHIIQFYTDYIRFRIEFDKETISYVFTKKFKLLEGISLEVETTKSIPINEKMINYEWLFPEFKKSIYKFRTVYVLNSFLKVELDTFLSYPYIRAEVEFPEEYPYEKFKLPKQFKVEREITFDKKLSNFALAKNLL